MLRKKIIIALLIGGFLLPWGQPKLQAMDPVPNHVLVPQRNGAPTKGPLMYCMGLINLRQVSAARSANILFRPAQQFSAESAAARKQ